jgi:adenylyl cyclase-associated protein
MAESIVNSQAEILEEEFNLLKSLLRTVAACQQPDQAKLWELLSPMQGNMEAIARLREANRKERDWSDHMMVMCEGAPCAGWVAVVTLPSCVCVVEA